METTIKGLYRGYIGVVLIQEGKVNQFVKYKKCGTAEQ